ncbi:MAG TPA: aminodeoxychorismate/anthranilate synthase component II [Chloroflexota bacterium]|nr:aminodeoxychorismate/anthranilate synthase component II [Chloroflexota bacterium]
MRLLMIDNFDSFTYNLVQYLRELGATVTVVRNDAAPAPAALLEEADGLVVSPGPCTPAQAGVSIEMLRLVGAPEGPRRPALGVCLGHQALAEAYGARVIRGAAPMHGKTSLVWHDGSPPFGNVPNPTEVMRYHSLVVDPQSVPAALRVTARTSDGTIMGLAHRDYPIYGVQFHPESILTASGKTLLRGFLDVVERHRAPVPALAHSPEPHR